MVLVIRNLDLLQWKDTDPSQIMDYKLKCVFENPVSSTVPANAPAAVSSARPDANATNGKNKAIGDTAKSSSKVKLHSLKLILLSHDFLLRTNRIKYFSGQE